MAANPIDPEHLQTQAGQSSQAPDLSPSTRDEALAVGAPALHLLLLSLGAGFAARFSAPRNRRPSAD